jgi:hypothetical protein
LGHDAGRQAHRRHPLAGAGCQFRVRRAGPADIVLLRAHLGLHIARQGARQFTSLVQAGRAVISRREQRRCPEPVGGPRSISTPQKSKTKP